ncbi:MAG: cupin domain-containing protein [Candidatus Dadabacteria bacterium]|nr:cupin domain-containing protein [Candidatus Dadabacteria bacterium]MDE0158487.1 cupin domain-containing protein [Candidatus Dadabacteria bacterium]MDE0477007.1 cupin domain-containing protein [Candidatus Dadabacteria bacterium]MXZ47761.1 cupin domain-containing protein [Candidatus Dadabacteria bacterium]MYB26577.1 cupin domain-containing protein [Candidatus Dadabacteria bacterium]
MKADHLIQRLGLKKLPGEGGYYKETYRSEEMAGEDRSLSTAIYYLITSEENSKMHRVNSDEIFHFYFGDPVQMLLLYPTGESRIVFMGDNLPSGQRTQLVIPKGTWQGAMVVEGEHGYAFMGTTMAPGFELEDFELGAQESLLLRFPQHENLIRELT